MDRQGVFSLFSAGLARGSARLLLAGVFFLLGSLPAWAEANLPHLVLRNATGLTIGKVTVALEDTAGSLDSELRINPGEKASLVRLRAPAVRLVIRHNQGEFVFAGVDMSGPADIPAELRLAQPNVPVLEFLDEKGVRAVYAGSNSAWKFAQVLGAFPYQPGVTRRAEAQALGAVPLPGTPRLMSGPVYWRQENWEAGLIFAGEAPEAVLRTVLLKRRVGDAGPELQDDIAAALAAQAYIPFRREINGRDFDLKAAAGEDAAEAFADRAVNAAGGKLAERVDWYASADLDPALREAFARTGALEEALNAHPAEILVEARWSAQDGFLIITLTRAATYEDLGLVR